MIQEYTINNTPGNAVLRIGANFYLLKTDFIWIKLQYSCRMPDKNNNDNNNNDEEEKEAVTDSPSPDPSASLRVLCLPVNQVTFLAWNPAPFPVNHPVIFPMIFQVWLPVPCQVTRCLVFVIVQTLELDAEDEDLGGK
jgi:hypothetical protein